MSAPPDVSDDANELKTAASNREREQVVLRLYVAGNLPRSQRAISNVQQLCQQHLSGRFDLEIIDIYQQPAVASSAQLIAAPTLIKTLPPPSRRLMGDLSQTDKVMLALDIEPAGSSLSHPQKLP